MRKLVALLFSAPARSLRRNFWWSFLGYMIYGVTQWVIIVLIARMCNPSAVGQFALGLALSAPINFLFNFNLRSMQATDAKGEYRFSEYMALRAITTVLAFATTMLACSLLGYSRETFLVVTLVAAAKGIESLTDISHGLFQKIERMDIVCISVSTKGIASVAGMYLGLYFSGNLMVGLAAMILTWLLVAIGYDFPRSISLSAGGAVRNRGATSVRWRMLRRLAFVAFPLGISGFLWSLQSSIPRLFIERHLTMEEVGIFSALAYILMVGARFVLALNYAINSRLSQHFANGAMKSFVNLILKVLGIDLCIGLAIVTASFVLGEHLLRLIYGTVYAEHSDTFVVLMAAGIPMYITASLEHTATALRLIGVQVQILLTGLATITAMCMILIPRFGITGAAWAMLIASLVQVVWYSAAIASKVKPLVDNS
ncbi:MAG: oligosaccharide flippase family protein [Deferrisomatales bacterium]|nr:oligosaccharide flippase family protein [Deferrisomatales bacterium]